MEKMMPPRYKVIGRTEDGLYMLSGQNKWSAAYLEVNYYLMKRYMELY